MNYNIVVQEADFSLQDEYAALLKQGQNIGAVVSFTGLVRDRDTTTPLAHLYLEHFPEVTEQEIARIVAQANERWRITACTVIHCVGLLAADEQIVLVLVAQFLSLVTLNSWLLCQEEIIRTEIRN